MNKLVLSFLILPAFAVSAFSAESERKVKTEVFDYSHLSTENLLSAEESPYTFRPQESSAWEHKNLSWDSEKREWILDNPDDKYESPKKRLANICAISELFGWCSDTGNGVWLVNPAQRNRFCISNPVVAEKDFMMLDKGGDGCFSCKYLGGLANKIQILLLADGGGGSWTDASYYFLGFEKQAVISDYDSERNFVGIKSFGNIAKKNNYSCKPMLIGNVFAVYYEGENGEIQIDIYSFEKDNKLLQKTKSEIVERVRTLAKLASQSNSAKAEE